MKKISKEELKGPDSFVSFTDRVAKAIDTHKTPVLAALGAAFVIGGGAVGFDKYRSYQEERAQEAYYQAKSSLEKKKEELAQAKPEEKNKESAKAKEEPKTPETLQSQYSSAIQQYKDMIRKYPNSRAALGAAMDLASLYAQYGDVAAAIEALKPVSQKPPKNNIYFGLINTQLGNLYTQTKNYPEAIKHYTRVAEVEAQRYLHPDVLLKIGVFSEKTGDTAKAKEVYQRVVKEFGSSSASRNAKSYLRFLELTVGQKTESPSEKAGG